MKKSNSALLSLAFLILGGMVATGFILKVEAAKIDLSDTNRNYDSEAVAPFTVLKISGSNGYPIVVEQAASNSLTVLRRRKSFLKTEVRGDTLEVIFSGANMPLDQADKSTTPPGVIIKSKEIKCIYVTDTYTRIKGFTQTGLDLHLQGRASNDFLNCRFGSLSIEAKNQSRFQFKEENKADTIRLKMENTTVGFFRNITFSELRHQMGDSASVVLSNQSLEQLPGK